ncbi:MAG TPA: Lrp/AsnC family transcriptional regulator [candidate division Zixibacteria bacterium]|nr:Lrp/AsnC family transcriptional regulator [candidate division Zixibacteria bacterium]
MINFNINFTEKELSVLIALQENPLATYDWLAERVGLVKSLIFGILKKLSAGAEPLFRVIAQTNLLTLDQESVDILVQANSEEKLQLIEKLCYEHPYTSYGARCFGNTNGMQIQFTIPKGTSSLIHELFNKLQNKKLIDNFIILPFTDSHPIYSTPNVDYWNSENHKWEFNWGEWFNLTMKKQIPKEIEGETGSAKKWLTRGDIAILKEVSRNARRKNLELIDILKKDGYDFSPQTFSRRLKTIKSECISEYRVLLNPSYFELYSAVLIYGTGSKDELLELQSKMQQKPVPFSSTFKIAENHLYWYLHLPPTHLSDLLYHLRKKLNELHFNHIDYVRSRTFLLWPPTFDEETHEWRKDKAFIVDNVLNTLDKK